MTTNNIDGLDGLEELIGKIGPKVESREKAVRTELKGRDKHEQNIARGAAALLKKSQDRRNELTEELDQIDDIQRMTAALLAAANQSVETEAPAPATPAPAAPAAPAPAPATPAPPAVQAPAPANPAPAEDPVSPPPAAAVPTQQNNVIVAAANTVRNFTLLQRILAIIVAFIALRVGLATDDFGPSSGFGYWLKEILWVAGWTIAGFGFGGFIGNVIDVRRGNATA